MRFEYPPRQPPASPATLPGVARDRHPSTADGPP